MNMHYTIRVAMRSMSVGYSIDLNDQAKRNFAISIRVTKGMFNVPIGNIPSQLKIGKVTAFNLQREQVVIN